MKMWRPDARVTGPYPATEDVVGELNRVFTEAFTDRYRRDGLVGVRVPALNGAIWRYALRDAGAGAMVWRDEQDELVGFNIAHHSGVEGWMGPLAVRSDRQGLGVGTVMVRTAIDWLQGAGATTIGLETMPRTVDNIGFYSRLGFVPGHLTITLGGEVTGKNARRRGELLGEQDAAGRLTLIAACRDRLAASAPGYDFTRELELTGELDIGDTVVLPGPGGGVSAFALWHATPLAETRGLDELRVLKLFAESTAAFERIVGAVEACAVRLRIRRVAVRCQTRHPAAYQTLVTRGYQVRWTDLRMTLDGHPETALPDGEILFSNWEI